LLYPGKVTIFALFSIVMHLAFALLFAEVTPSFSLPPVKELSLTLRTRGGGEGEIVQSKAAWPMPARAEPAFSAEGVLKSFDAEIEKWTQFGLPGPPFFSPKETFVPRIDVAELAGRAYAGPPEGAFSRPPPESKVMPIADFALGPGFPEIFGSD
jgi:hypothetical protein